uniref:Uncharacterized protein n=1 Tax=Rhizophora mucronata TaxID=61149 RepID=A0A2P2N336_RHIMU
MHMDGKESTSSLAIFFCKGRTLCYASSDLFNMLEKVLVAIF